MAVLDEENVIEGAKGTLLHQYTVKLSPISLLEYRAWLFGEPHSRNKDKLLELTLLDFPPDERSMTYYQMSNSDQAFEKILVEPLQALPAVLFSKQWYTYQHAGHFYVDFAHPKLLGGDFRAWGNAQEEILFCEFPKLAHLAFATSDRTIHATDDQGKPTPFIVPDAKRHTVLYDLYRDNLDKYTREEIESKVVYVEHHVARAVHILGMAAIPWEEKNQSYREHDLRYLLRTAYLAFEGAKMTHPEAVVHTGCWGCGVFRNSEKTITVIQLLAATLADVEIIFDGIEMMPHYTEAFLEEAKALIASKKNAKEVFNTILSYQEKDRTWAPKS